MRDASPATLKIAYDFTAYAFPRLLQFPNVRLHDFRDVKDVTHDLGNYGDVIHHSPAIDLKILSWLAERKYVVDRAAPLASLERLKAQVEAYRVETVGWAKRSVPTIYQRIVGQNGGHAALCPPYESHESSYSSTSPRRRRRTPGSGSPPAPPQT